MTPAQASLHFHTLRHLKPVQIYGRLLFRIPRRAPRADASPPLRRQTTPFFTPPSRRPSLTGPSQLRLLNETRDLDTHGWDDPALSKLWRYNLHYFDDLNAENAPSRSAWHHGLIERWIARNPPAHGTGWEPYPTSLRIVNWIKWTLAGNLLSAQALESLATQARWLGRRLEHHIQGNHLFANAKALLFAGCFFAGSEAESWLSRGTKILRRELREQLLADGGHFELSPMYHALFLEDGLDLLNLLRAYGLDGDLALELEAASPGMRRWLAALTHPDGGIGFFNDAAFDVAPGFAAIEAYAMRLGLGTVGRISAVTHLAASGYLRLEKGPFTALLDMAKVGPDHLPGHAHADTLSFELSVGRQRVIVNSGTGEYGSGAERHRQRGTAAHNTLCVEGQNSSEVWAGFRVARRARPFGVTLREDAECISVVASHDGYRRLGGRPIHTRRWLVTRRGFTVRDELSGPIRQAQARFHFHPDVEARLSGRTVDLSCRGRIVLRAHVETGEPHLEASTWHPEFGLALPNACLAVACRDNRAAIRFEA